MCFGNLQAATVIYLQFQEEYNCTMMINTSQSKECKVAGDICNGKLHPKACCSCDRFILYGEGGFPNETYFENEKIEKLCPADVFTSSSKRF
jgi:hypothetical protein